MKNYSNDRHVDEWHKILLSSGHQMHDTHSTHRGKFKICCCHTLVTQTVGDQFDVSANGGH